MAPYRHLNGIVIIAMAIGIISIGMNSASAQTKESSPIDWEYEMAYQRGVQSAVWAVPAVSMINLRRANFSLGGGFNTVYYLSTVPTALQEALTANNQTPYTSVNMTTRDGPVVLEVPPASDRTAIFGSAVDIWQQPLVDIGPAGADRGEGGRYLFLPPGYDGEIPEGYIVVPMKTYNIFSALRNIPLGDAPFEEAANYSRQIRAYPLSEANSSPKGEYIDMAGRRLPTLPTFDLSFFRDIAQVIDEEPLLERDKAMGGLLASIGIEKGRSFEPTGKVKAALEDAIGDAHDYLEHLFETPGYSLERYWPDRSWLGVRRPSPEGFVFDAGDFLLLDERASLFHWATFFPKELGAATAYLVGQHDGDGTLMVGDGLYRLRVPADVPARDFWSLIVYGKETKAFIYSDEERVGLSSYDLPSMRANDDGSVDIYIGQSAPEGLESNWIPTAGNDFFVLFRFYGPEDAYFDKSFVLPDFERLE